MRLHNRRRGVGVLIVAATIALATADSAAAAILRVNPANPTPGDGSSWAAAYDDLQVALGAAVADDEIWVVGGTYLPTTTTSQAATFALGADVALYGGFAGTELTRDERDPVANPTILSGDIGTPDLGTDNVVHVVTINGGTTTRLDGVTVTRGAGLGTSEAASNAFAGARGGGVYVLGGSPTLHRVRFVENGSADSGLQGGAFASVNAADPLLVDVIFVENAGAIGGALYASSALRLVNVSFTANAGVDTLSTDDRGGAVFFDGTASVDLTNVIAWGNTYRNLLAPVPQPSSVGRAVGTTVDVRTSLLEGSGGSSAWDTAYGVDQGGNLDADPQFVNAAGRDLRLLARSVAIDAGDPAARPVGLDVDLDGESRVCGPEIDMGALEFQGIDCAPFDGTWSVATTGSDVATGLPGDPFASLAHAVAAAAWGDTIVLEAGTYTGASNQDVDLNGKALAIHSAAGDPTSVTLDFGGAVGVSFQTAAIDSTIGPHFRGLTFANATKGLEIDGIFGPGAPAQVTVTDCRFVGNVRGLDLRWTVATITNTDFIDQTGEGLYASSSGLTVSDALFQGNAVAGTMLNLGLAPFEDVEILRTDVLGNVDGMEIVPEASAAVVDSCVIDGNTNHGLLASSSVLGTLSLTGTEISNNGVGLQASVNLAVAIVGGRVVDNTGSGIELQTDGKDLSIDGCEIRGNGGWGIDGTSGAAKVGLARDTVANIDLLGSIFRDNASGGATLEGETFLVENCLVVENGGRGLELFRPAAPVNGPDVVDLVGTTIANNLAEGVWTDHDSVVVARVLITGNTGAAYATASVNPPLVNCTNVFGNATDYDGPLLGLDGQDGNVALDPLFCDPAGGDYGVISISPCLPASSGCGLIGAVGQSCAAEPTLASILDVGNDQGGQVRLTWDASHYDAPGGATVVTGYGIYRKQAVGQAPGSGRILGWDFLATVPARGDAGYQFVADTLCDSTAAGGACWTTFFISAETASPFTFYDSAPDSGYSVDNLSPPAPDQVTVSYAALSNELEWAPSAAPDLSGYLVFRVTNPGDVPTPETTPYAVTPVATMVDGDFAGGDAWDYSYYVAAVDFAGNRSAPVLQGSATSAPSAGRVTLDENVPNPFNPATEIGYSLAKEGPVVLRVYDVRGRAVRTLVDEVRGAGRHRARWDGRDDTGRTVASGTYFYRLRAGGVDLARSMLLLK